MQLSCLFLLVTALTDVALCNGEGCFLRLTVSSSLSQLRVSGTVSALGLSDIPMNYVGEQPMSISGSLYLEFPASGTPGGACQLPSTAQELADALPAAAFARPEGAGAVHVWPSSFILEVIGTNNTVEDVEIGIVSGPAPGAWQDVDVAIERMLLKVRSPFVDDVDTVLSDVAGELTAPAAVSTSPGAESGSVRLDMQLPLRFLLPTASDDPNVPESTVHIFMDMNVTAEAHLGCSSPCGVNGRCAPDSAGEHMCECACGWKGPNCSVAAPCPAFRSDGAAPATCLQSPPALAPPPVPADPPLATADGQCLPTQMPTGWQLPESTASGAAAECRASGCECLPGFWGPDCAMCTANEACQVLAARQGMPVAGATCDLNFTYTDRSLLSPTKKHVMCYPKSPEILSQVQEVLISCWTNLTYNGEFNPPAGLMDAVAERGKDPVDKDQNLCFVKTDITLGGQVGTADCMAYNCKLDRNGDIDCMGAICNCLGSEEDCKFAGVLLQQVQGAAVLCSALPGEDCQVTLRGLPVAEFVATCRASQCIVDGDLDSSGSFVDGITLDARPEKDRSLAAGLAYIVIILVCALLIYIGAMLLVGGTAPNNGSSKVAPETSTRKHCLRFGGVSVHVRQRGGSRDQLRAILSDVSGELRSGSITGLMGPSGSGKTTLLNVLMKRVSDLGTVHVQGSILLNDHPVPSWFPEVIGYVSQFEALIAGLTACEMVYYSAALRLPAGTRQAEISQAVEATLKLLDISGIADSITIPLPGSGMRGISGGEQKRVAVAMELVAKPQLLFLDEATSGLDSFLAESLMRSLREYSQQGRGRMVIATVHQPSVTIFGSLDQVLCLSDGRLAYSGPPSQVVPFFAARGLSADRNTSAPELMISAVSSVSIIANIQAGQWEPHSTAEQGIYSPGSDFEASSVTAEKPRRPWSRQVAVLAWRTMVITVRSPALVLLHWALGTVVGIFMGVAYLKVPRDVSGIQNRNGALFFSLLFFGLASLSAVDSIFGERHAVRAEALAGHYNPALYVLIKGLVDALLLRIIPAFLFLLPLYYLMGLNPNPSRAAIFFGAIPTFSAAVGWLSMFLCTCTSTPGKANFLIIVVLLILVLFGGSLSNIESMPKVINLLPYLSPFRYAFEALLSTELDGQTIIPKLGEIELNEYNITGNQIIEQLGLRDDNDVFNIMMLNFLAVMFWIMGGLSLYLKYRLMPAVLRIPESAPLPTPMQLFWIRIAVTFMM